MKKRIRRTFLPVLGLGLWLGLGAAAWAEETDAVEDLQGPKLRELTIEGTPVRQFRRKRERRRFTEIWKAQTCG